MLPFVSLLIVTQGSEVNKFFFSKTAFIRVSLSMASPSSNQFRSNFFKVYIVVRVKN